MDETQPAYPDRTNGFRRDTAGASEARACMCSAARRHGNTDGAKFPSMLLQGLIVIVILVIVV